MTGTIVGTPAYMAPEQAELKPVSPCTDIYALGLLLYEMITGVPAFDGDTPVAVALKQIREYPKRPREIVPELSGPIESVIMKCLQKDAAKRFQSADEFETALVKAARSRPLSPWEAAVNRWLARADVEIRTRMHRGIECAEAFLKRQDWRGLLKSQKDSRAILGAAGFAGALTILLLVWGGKPHTINAHPVQAASQNSLPPATAANDSNPGFPSLSAQNSFQPIATHEVNLYQKAKVEVANTPSVDPSLPIHDLRSEPPKPRAVSVKPDQIVERVNSPIVAETQKHHAHTPTPSQLQALAKLAQPVVPAPAGDPTSTAPVQEKESSQPRMVT